MEIDEDDYVIEDKESICLGEASKETMMARETIYSINIEENSTATSTTTYNHNHNISNNHNGSSSLEENRHSSDVRHTSTSIDNSYDRIEEQDFHDEKKLLESV